MPTENSPSQLAEVEREYQRAEAEFDLAKRAVLDYRITNPTPDSVHVINNAALVHVNTLKNEDPMLSALCAEKERARKLRNSLLAQRARLLVPGLI